MLKLLNYFIILFLVFFSASCTSTKHLDTESHSALIVPQPKEIVSKKGEGFNWKENSKIIIVDDKPEIRKTAEFLQQYINKFTNKEVEIQVGNIDSENVIIFALGDFEDKEAYTIDVNKSRILIKAPKPVGLFYGLQSLLQLLPPEIIKPAGTLTNSTIPAICISDEPRFTYRGMHLDVSRHFFTKDEVLKYIDLLAMYKFNYLHWHLTDAAGWRIEIKKYPLLTQKTAFRTKPTYKEFWKEGDRKYADEGTSDAYGGYYTQEEIKEIVKYAADKFVVIIPEFEMPGHSEEVFVAYPKLSCSGEPYVNSDFCAGNEQTFEFIEDVLTEIMELFPSEYIHIGGDEAGKRAWKTCPKCQKRIKTEELKNVDELQSYFIKRVSKFLTSKGRNPLGWDEIIQGGLDSNSTVMLWRDPKTAIEIAKQGNNIIMTPNEFCYFDYYQDDPTTEPEAIGGYLPLSKVYSFEPVNCDSLAEYYIGVQANIWTEYITNFKHVEYMVFPRALALAEVAWSPKEKRNWEDFKMRLTNQYPRLDYLDVNYHKPSYELTITQKADTINKTIAITFETERYKPIIRYTIDGNSPTASAKLYTDTILLDKTVMLKAAIFENDKPQKIFTRNVGYHLGVGKTVTYHKKWSSYPAGGETALVDGIRGGLSYLDKLWQGFLTNLDVTIDLGSIMEVNTFNANFMQLTGPGVYMPEYVEVSISTDGKKYDSVLIVKNDVPTDFDRLRFKDFSGKLGGKNARYIKVFAKKQRGFMFIDELVIK